jgi:hypothetical protein
MISVQKDLHYWFPRYLPTSNLCSLLLIGSYSSLLCHGLSRRLLLSVVGGVQILTLPNERSAGMSQTSEHLRQMPSVTKRLWPLDVGCQAPSTVAAKIHVCRRPAAFCDFTRKLPCHCIKCSTGLIHPRNSPRRPIPLSKNSWLVLQLRTPFLLLNSTFLSSIHIFLFIVQMTIPPPHHFYPKQHHLVVDECLVWQYENLHTDRSHSTESLRSNWTFLCRNKIIFTATSRSRASE